MAVISMKHFLEAGVHFGHQTKRWNPKMAPYIYGVKSGIHIIDLRQSLRKLQEAYQYVKEASTQGKPILFVGTKQPIQKIIFEEALRCESPYINFRWLGGFLTNFSTVKQSIGRLQSYEEMAGEDRIYEGILKKEALQIERKREKLDRSLGGVRTLKDVPGMIFIVDCKREHLAVREAQKLGIPIVGVADTNCDPTGIDYVIPGNDDSPRAVKLFANVIATAVLEGKAVRAATAAASKAEEPAPRDDVKAAEGEKEEKKPATRKRVKKAPAGDMKKEPAAAAQKDAGESDSDAKPTEAVKAKAAKKPSAKEKTAEKNVKKPSAKTKTDDEAPKKPSAKTRAKVNATAESKGTKAKKTETSAPQEKFAKEEKPAAETGVSGKKTVKAKTEKTKTKSAAASGKKSKKQESAADDSTATEEKAESNSD